jgi:RNA polymerase sigma factor (TIGR02999 family)
MGVESAYCNSRALQPPVWTNAETRLENCHRPDPYADADREVAGAGVQFSAVGVREQRAVVGKPSERSVTQLLLAWGEGEDGALDALTPIVYDELRRLARRSLAGERSAGTLQATALVHEAFIRLVDVRRVRWQNRAHFYAVAAKLMRRVLVDLARTRLAQKRGGRAKKVTLDEGMLVSDRHSGQVVAIDDALYELAKVDARKAQVVELRFFGGLSVDESAEVLKVSAETVMRDWKMAKAWLLRELSES